MSQTQLRAVPLTGDSSAHAAVRPLETSTAPDVVDPATRVRVLIAVHNHALGDLVQDILADAGYGVELCRNGLGALQLSSTRAFDAWLIDRDLTSPDGMDVVRRLRHEGVVSPVLMLLASDIDYFEAIEAGTDDCLSMPFGVNELLWRLDALLG